MNQFFYTVQPGDSLYLIAKRWEIPLDTLIKANNMKFPFNIYIGLQLAMPPGVNCYRVKHGDTLFSISKSFKVPLKVIIEANNIRPPYYIKQDDVIKIPPGVDYYIVQPGDTLWNIAQRYNTQVDVIRDANQISSPFLFTGEKLKIPYFLPLGSGKIVFTSLDNEKYSIRSFDFQVKEEKVLVSQFVNAGSIPYVSPDEKKLAFIGENNKVYIYNEETTELISLGQSTEYSTMNWSADSIKLVYVTPGNISIYNIQTKKITTIDQPDSSYPQWFPDGKELLFQSPDSSGIKQLYRIREDGSNKKQIGNNIWNFYNNVELSPDGSFILYTTPSASVSIIYTLEINTGKIHQVPSGPQGKDYYPKWSTDSTRIIYSSTNYRPGSFYSQINIAELQGRNYQTYAVSNCFSTPVSWLHDERIIYLSGCNTCLEENQANEMWLVDLRKPVPVPVVSGIKIIQLQVLS